MAKVVVAKLNPTAKTKVGGAQASLLMKRVRGAEGKVKALATLDTGSLTFGHDLRSLFGKNVAKARRDNKRVTGATDVAPAKK